MTRLGGLLYAACAIAVFILIGHRVGAPGLLLGLGLAAVPVPFVAGAFVWAGRVRPQPAGRLATAFGWGACVASLAALGANTLAYRWLTAAYGDDRGELLGIALVAPLVEELLKAGALAMILVTARDAVRGPLDGIVVTGLSGAGFAFTENVLYLGRAYGEGLDGFSRDGTGEGGLGDAWRMFVARALLSPFAHPLFTAAIGIAAGAAVAYAVRTWTRVLCLAAGYVTAAGLHAAWNGSTGRGMWFAGVYAGLMVPAGLGLTLWTCLTRRAALRAVEAQLPRYAAAGWFARHEPYVLASLADRRRQVRAAERAADRAAVRAYQADATALALLRAGAVRRGAGPAYDRREADLLSRIVASRARAAGAVAAVTPSPRAPLALPPRVPRPVARAAWRDARARGLV